MKKNWFAQTIPVQFIHPFVHHLFGEAGCPVVIMHIKLCKDTRKESMAFDLKVKRDFATKS